MVLVNVPLKIIFFSNSSPTTAIKGLMVGLPMGVRPVGFYFPTGRVNCLIISNNSAPVGN